MSIEIYVLSDQKLNSMSEWQERHRRKGFPATAVGRDSVCKQPRRVARRASRSAVGI